jgi:type II secretory pathway pseudopilin PulG
MSQFTDIQSAFGAFLNDWVGYQAAVTAVADLGERPGFPTQIKNQTQIDNAETAMASYDAALASAVATMNSLKATARTAAIAVINAMDVLATSEDSRVHPLPNQWVEVTVTGVNYWIGSSPMDRNEVDGLPLLAFTTDNPAIPFSEMGEITNGGVI